MRWTRVVHSQDCTHESRSFCLRTIRISKDMLGAFDWDLMLSGHTHGGQVIIPFDGPRFAPVVDKRYVAGLRPWGSRQIHVSRGVGNLGGVRFGCRPEVSLLKVG